MRYGVVVLAAGLTGLLSFAFLAVAIGSEYWYIIDVNHPNLTESKDLSSHSGLWRIYEGKNATSNPIDPFQMDTSKLSEVHRHLNKLHKAIVILLPFSLVLLVFGWILGLVSSMARSPCLLSGSASYFLFSSLLTLAGLSLYISYSQQALEEFQRVVPPENLAYVDLSFGWSLAMAWLSYSLEVATGLLLMLTARIAQLRRHHESHRSCLERESERESERRRDRHSWSSRFTLDQSRPVQTRPNQTSPDQTRADLTPMQWID